LPQHTKLQFIYSLPHDSFSAIRQKLSAKSIKATQKTQNTIIYYLHTHTHKRNTN